MDFHGLDHPPALLSQSLAAMLGDKPVLMRGHGNVVVGPSVCVATARAIFTDENSRMQAVALSLGGPIKYVSPGEGALRDNDPKAGRAGRRNRNHS